MNSTENKNEPKRSKMCYRVTEVTMRLSKGFRRKIDAEKKMKLNDEDSEN